MLDLLRRLLTKKLVPIDPHLLCRNGSELKKYRIAGHKGPYLLGYAVDGCGSTLIAEKDADDTEHFNCLLALHSQGDTVTWVDPG